MYAKLSKKSILKQLNNMINLVKDYFFFFYWGFYYWNAGLFAYNKITGNYQT